MEALLGEIKLWPLSWAPVGWLFCDGSLLDVREYQALFSLLETRYGGDGIRSFALPSLNGKFVLGPDTPAKAGLSGGNAKTSFSFPMPQVPEHTHTATFVPGTVKPVDPVTIEVNNTAISANTVNTPSGNHLSKGYPSSGTFNLKSYAAAGDGTFLAGVKGGGGGGIVDGKVTIDPTGAKNVVINGDFSTIPPYLALNFIICCSGGEYPARS
jgi:microcystin-dependent protein